MSENSLDKMLNRPPDFVYTAEQAVADGVIVDLAARDQDVLWQGRPIRWCSRALYDALVPVATAEWTTSDEDAAMRMTLLTLALDARDVAQPGEPQGDHFATPPRPELGGEPVWLLSTDAGWSAMFPADY